MPTIKSRSAANLPAVPSSIGHRSLSSWAGIRVHHTGGAFSSWRSIHDWQTSGRPPGDRLAYIGYSFGISSGDVWTLRGFDHHPAHDFINSHLGVVFGGNFENRLPRDEDLDALVWFVHEAERRTGKKLPISTHREVGQTTCPGRRLHQWIKQTLPGRLAGEEDDVSAKDVWTYRIAQPQWVKNRWNVSDNWMAKSLLRSAYGHARSAKDWTRDYGREILAGQAAILAQAGGEDVAAAVRTELERAAARERAERADELGELEELLQEAAAERTALAELVAQAQSGELDAAAVVDEIGRRLVGDQDDA